VLIRELRKELGEIAHLELALSMRKSSLSCLFREVGRLEDSLCVSCKGIFPARFIKGLRVSMTCCPYCSRLDFVQRVPIPKKR